MWEFSNEMRTSVFQHCKDGLVSSLFSVEIPASTNFLYIFGQMFAVDVLHEYVEYIPQVFDTSQGAVSRVDGTVLTVARLNVFLSTVIYCFCIDSVDKVGSYCQTA